MYYVWIGDTFRSVLYDDYEQAYLRYKSLVNGGYSNVYIKEVI